MSPLLEDGDYVLTKKPRRLSVGLLYVINHSDLGRIVKRLKSREGSRYRFEGVNPGSAPGAIIGLVEPARIAGRVILAVGRSGIRRL